MSINHARGLRRNATEAEKALWRILRARQLASAKFRRQQPVGPYIADFVSFAYQLVIECDGGQHADNTGDAVRDDWFAKQGFRTLRFWNNDVLGNPEGVAETISFAVNGASPPPGNDK